MVIKTSKYLLTNVPNSHDASFKNTPVITTYSFAGVDSKNIQNPDTQKNFDEIATQMYPVENMEHLALTQATQRRSCPEHSTDDDEKQTSTNPFSTPENMKNSSNTFSDWHFIEKSPVNTESDDDSIVIIEREVCRPMDSASLTSTLSLFFLL